MVLNIMSSKDEETAVVPAEDSKSSKRKRRSGKQSKQNHQDASRRKMNAKVLSDPTALSKGRAAMDAKWLTVGLDLPDYTPKVAAAARAAGVPISLRGVGAAVASTYSRALSLAPQKVAAQCTLQQAYRACLLQVTCKLSEQNKAGSPSFVRRPDNVQDVFMAEDLASVVKAYQHTFPLIANIMSGIGWFQVGADSYRTFLPSRGATDPFTVTADRLRGYVDGYNGEDDEGARMIRSCNTVPWFYDADLFVNPEEIVPFGWPNRELAHADLEAFDGLLTFLESKYMRVSEVNYEPKAACHSLVSREIDNPEDCGSIVYVGQTAQFSIPYATTWHSRTALDGQTWARGVLSLLGEGPPDPLRSPVLATSTLTADWQDFATSSFGQL